MHSVIPLRALEQEKYNSCANRPSHYQPKPQSFHTWLLGSKIYWAQQLLLTRKWAEACRFNQWQINNVVCSLWWASAGLASPRSNSFMRFLLEPPCSEAVCCCVEYQLSEDYDLGRSVVFISCLGSSWKHLVSPNGSHINMNITN